jgi:hypothetical protein
MSDVFDVLIRALETATDAQLDALIRGLQSYQQRQKDGVLMRQIVADNRGAPTAPTPTVRVEGAAPGGGWVDAPRLGDWQHQVGVREADRLMDAADRIDAARRAGR